jgi:hypothetical protein
MRVLFVMVVASVLTACASQPCRGRLSPVNGPVNASVAVPTPDIVPAASRGSEAP